jgi:hypothetical protein
VDRDQGGTLIGASDNVLTLRVRTGEAVEMAALKCVPEAAPKYFQRVTGECTSAGPDVVRNVIIADKPLRRGTAS